ncbi:energy transducer TonB [Hymenobacter sp. BT770]|uniref:energy transducer TonB n=1 Tax=Hymenobacter sp. BT770 TaxID=2886942 RepID=UPI001D10021A|nr:energy transducer TonB [Hymenobacter sp. BT770]MCC3154117.1 energy transducer TonB [Hymenobacter sp. BT770]MDO3416261.1 energy transducer TonB [Hymenobacter sp. BT770]
MSPADSPFAPLPAPGPHPATAELRAYAAGTLPPAEQHRIEAHALECERCAELVDGFSMTDAATTDQAVAALRTRLQARTQVPEPGAVGTRWVWPRLAAAAVLVGAVAGGIWSWEHKASPTIAAHEQTAPLPPTSPTARTEAATELPSAPPAAEATPPKAPTATDYAAVAPAQAQRVASEHRPVRRSHRSAAASQKRPAVASRAAQPGRASAPAPAGTDETASSQVISSAMPAAASKSSVSLAQNDEAARERDTLPDSVAARGSAMAGQLARALSPSTNAAMARVAATPMPAALAIKPSPMGGQAALHDYLRREAAAFEPEPNAPRLSGTVRLQIVVGADGKVSSLKVVRGLRADYDAEALRMVCDGPAWQPGVSGGRRAPLPVELTVSF